MATLIQPRKHLCMTPGQCRLIGSVQQRVRQRFDCRNLNGLRKILAHGLSQNQSFCIIVVNPACILQTGQRRPYGRGAL
jgi:hypothetical protein